MKRTMPVEVSAMLKRLGSAVKSARISKSALQSEITNATGLSQNIVTNLETGSGSAVSSLLIVLKYLDLFDDIIYAIEDTTSEEDRKRSKVLRPKNKEPVVLSKKSVKSFASHEELHPEEGEAVELSASMDEEQLKLALEVTPTNIYRINGALVRKLSDEGSELAIFTNNILYRTPSGNDRMREVYYASTLEGAIKTDLIWSVHGFIRKPNAAITAIVNRDSITVDNLSENAKRNFLNTLRMEFASMGVFVDSLTIDYDSDEPISRIMKDDREVRGERYRALYARLLDAWLCSVNNTEVS